MKLFGSRAKGVHRPQSDIDLALWGELDELAAESIAFELDELPLPYQYDVKAFETITLQPLRDHVKRVGVALYQK